ncbi:MAG: T9SS type A sorting domain-containing protein [Bacteroidia bacterium]|nr:T9SS type A sorting domain-containing protein [Bacteroidia bacterium]
MVVTAGLSDRNIDTTDVFYLAIDTIDGTVLDSQRFFVDYDITQIGGFAHYTNGSYILVGTLDNDGQTDGFIQRLAHDFVFDNGIEPWFATFGDTLNDQATSVTVDDQQRIFVGANIGKGGGKYDGKIYVFTSPTDSTGTPIDTIDIPHPDPSKNLEIQKLVWNNQGQKLHIGGTIENEQGKNDIMIARQNQGLSLDYIKSTPTLANTKRLTNLKANPTTGEIFTTAVLTTDTGDVYTSIKFDEVEYTQPPLLDTTEIGGTYSYFQNRGQLTYADSIPTDSIVKEVLYYANNKGLPAFIRSKGFSVVLSAIDTSAITLDTLQRVDFNFVAPKSGVTKMYALDSTEFFHNYYFAHCPAGIKGVHANTAIVEKSVYNGLDVYYTGNNRGMRMQATFDAGVNPYFELEVSGEDTVIVSDSNWVAIHTFKGVFNYRVLAYQTNGVLLDTLNIVYDDQRLKFDVEEQSINFGTIVQLDFGKLTQSVTEYGNLEHCTTIGSGSLTEFNDVTANETNILMTGYTDGLTFPISTGQNFGTTGNDAIVVNLKNDYSPFWAVFCGGSMTDDGGAANDMGNGVAIDNNGIIYVVGETYSIDLPVLQIEDAYFDGSADGCSPNCDKDAFILKILPDGSLEWLTYFGSEAEISPDYFTDIITNSNNEIYAVGHRSSGADLISLDGAYNGTSGGGLIVKFSASLELLWSCATGTNNTVVQSLALGDENKLHICGVTGGAGIPVTTPSGAYTQSGSNGDRDGFVIKFDATNNVYWASYFGGDYLDNAYGIVVDAYGHIYITGQTLSGNSFPTANPSLDYFQGNSGTTNYPGDAFFTQFGITGNLISSTFYGGTINDAGYNIATDYWSRVFVTGSTNSTEFPLMTNNPANSYSAALNTNTSGSRSDAFILTFNIQTNRIWTTCIGGGGVGNTSGNDIGYGIYEKNEKLFLVGATTSSLDFPYKNYNNNSYYANSLSGAVDGFLAAFDLTEIVGVEELSKINVNENSLLLFPNPTSGSVTFNPLNYTCKNLIIIITDMMGKTVLTKSYSDLQKNEYFNIDVSILAKGTYIASFKSENNVVVKKIVIQ